MNRNLVRQLLRLVILSLFAFQVLLYGCTKSVDSVSLKPTSTATLSPVLATNTITPIQPEYRITPIETISGDCSISKISPDFQWMVMQCSQNDELVVKKIGEIGTTPLFGAGYTTLGYYPLAFSPDSTKLIVIDTHDRDKKDSIWVFDVGQWQTPTMLYPESQVLWNPNPVWSPDGQTVSISYLEAGQAMALLDMKGNIKHSIPYGDVYKRVTEISNSFGPTWSPDSKELAYTTYDDGVDAKPVELWALDTTTNEKKLLYSGKAGEVGIYHPVWSPDGTKIALDQQYQQPYGLYMYDIENHSFSVLQVFRGQFSFYWSPDGAHIAVNNNLGQLYVISVLPKKSEYIGYYDFLLGWKDKNNLIVENDGVLELISFQ